MNFLEYLYEIGQYALAINIAALITYYLIAPKHTAFGRVLIYLILLAICHFFFEGWLLSLEQPEYKSFVRNAWYLGFALTDFLFIKVCIWDTKRLGLHRDKFTNMFLVTVFALGFVQLARYLDRVVLGTDILGSLYKNAIPSLNVILSGISVSYVAITLIKLVFTKDSGKNKC